LSKKFEFLSIELESFRFRIQMLNFVKAQNKVKKLWTENTVKHSKKPGFFPLIAFYLFFCGTLLQNTNA
jgi:hypothetical protein